MAQARRKTAKAKRRFSLSNQALQGLGILFAGIVIGSLSTLLWQGTRFNTEGIGSGIRTLIDQSKPTESAEQATLAEPWPPATADLAQHSEPNTHFDFFKVLPQIEVTVPNQPTPEAPTTAASQPESATAAEPQSEPKPEPEPEPEAKPAPQPRVVAQAAPSGLYMLQAGSFRHATDAERLSASLALQGMTSAIQKVTIDGSGQYRVRLGPFTYQAMRAVEAQLAINGVNALRLKVSQPQ